VVAGIICTLLGPHFSDIGPERKVRMKSHNNDDAFASACITVSLTQIGHTEIPSQLCVIISWGGFGSGTQGRGLRGRGGGGAGRGMQPVAASEYDRSGGYERGGRGSRGRGRRGGFSGASPAVSATAGSLHESANM